MLNGCVYPAIRTLILRSVRKFTIYYNSIIGIFLFYRLCVSLVYKTLLKTLAMLRLSSITTLYLSPAYTVYIFSSSRYKAVSTEHCFWVPICVYGRSAYVSARKRTLFAMIALSAFPSVLSSVISRYALGSV